MTTLVEFAPPNYENPSYETIPESVRNLLGTAGSASMVRLPEEVPAQNPELRSFLEDHIVGQRPAIEAIVQAVSRVNVRTDDKPIASMLFLGPTGTGKTEVTKVLHKALETEGITANRVHLDCSQLGLYHEASAFLLGSPAGYLGHGNTSFFSPAKFAAKGSKNVTILVLDELEKASDALPQVLLPALEEGAVTLKNGMVTSFANTIVIATSNVGAQEMSAAVRPNFGFSPSSGPAEKTSQMVESAALAGLKQRFQHMPEFLGRFTDTIVFMPHGEAELLQILDLAIADKNEHFRENHGVEICLTSKARHHILRRITPERHLGARPLKQAVRDMVEWPFSGYLSAGHLQGGKRLIACLEDELNGCAGTPKESRLAFFVADAPDLAQYATKPLLQIAAAPHEGDTTIIPDVQVEPERSDLA